MKLLGLTGTMGCGKSTATKIIEKDTDYTVSLMKLAQPLYDIQEFIYNTVEPVHKRPKGFIKDRKLLQWLGTEWGRQVVDSNLWINLWKAKVSSFKDKEILIICDDVRYDNEAEAIRLLGGKIIKIVSNRQNGIIDNGTGIKNHPSELGISQSLLDAEVPNSGTLEEFEKVLKHVNEYLGVW